MDPESDEEMGSQKDDVGSPNRPESRSSSVANGNDPQSDDENAPYSPDENAPVSPELEPQSPDNEPGSSPNHSGSEDDPESPEPPPHSPVGSVADAESIKDADENEEGETQEQNQNDNSEDEEVVREDADSEEEGHESEREEDNNQNGDQEVAEADENADKSSVVSNEGESNNQDQAEDDDDNASVEERASIHSDNEDEEPSNDQETANDDEAKEETGEGTSGLEDATQKISNNEDDNEENDEKAKKDDESDANSEVEELIADIFGESDEDEEFEGFGEEDVEKAKRKSEQKKKTTRALSDSEEDETGEKKDEDNNEAADNDAEKMDAENADQVDGDAKKDSSDDDDDDGSKNNSNIEIYDFDIMLQKKREEMSTRRRKRGYDIINDSDDLIADIIQQMSQAAEEDRNLNKNRLAATKKLKLLNVVNSQLKKADLKVAFLDQGVLTVMTEWLTPLPDKSLPHLQIRQSLIKLLGEFPPIDQSLLKSSGIGRAIMYLYKHPKETKENRIKAGRLISEWSRPIFNLKTDFQSISKEEREKRDFDHMPKRLKMRLEGGLENSQDIDTALVGDDKALRPGEKGWIGRARVPVPSTKDYVVRPKWNVEAEFSRASKKQVSRLDKHMRNLKEKKKQNKIQRAVSISVEGRKMPL